MAHILTCILALLFFLSGAATKGNVEIWQSPLAAETTGAENAINGVRLNQQLSAQSAFNASGGLSEEAIAGAREIIPSAELGNPTIPSGFSKFSTGTFDSPSGPFQVHFYQNPTTGEIWTGLDYKTVFNNLIGH